MYQELVKNVPERPGGEYRQKTAEPFNLYHVVYAIK
jgi:hypothetical protein